MCRQDNLEGECRVRKLMRCQLSIVVFYLGKGQRAREASRVGRGVELGFFL